MDEASKVMMSRIAGMNTEKIKAEAEASALSSIELSARLLQETFYEPDIPDKKFRLEMAKTRVHGIVTYGGLMGVTKGESDGALMRGSLTVIYERAKKNKPDIDKSIEAGEVDYQEMIEEFEKNFKIVMTEDQVKEILDWLVHHRSLA